MEDKNGGTGRKVFLLLLTFFIIITFPLFTFLDIGDDSLKFMIVAITFVLIVGFHLTKPDSPLIWMGKKSFTLYIPPEEDDGRIKMIRDLLTRPGIEYSITEFSCDETKALLELALKKQKTELYSRKAEGKSVPEELLRRHEETKKTLELLNDPNKTLRKVLVQVDARKIDKKTATNLIQRARELTGN